MLQALDVTQSLASHEDSPVLCLADAEHSSLVTLTIPGQFGNQTLLNGNSGDPPGAFGSNSLGEMLKPYLIEM